MIVIPEYARYALDMLKAAGFEAYAVGGCVRDSLMGNVPQDWDICTSAMPEQTKTVFNHHKVIETGIKHGTITLIIDDNKLEITTFRTEGGYADNRHPDSVEFVSNLEEDLKRRDFTVNAMAYNGEIVDLFGGREDIERKIIRCVGDPDERFTEDALRIMRALRFSSRLGFVIEKNTSDAIHTCAPLLNNIAGERILSELRGILMGDNVERILNDYSDVFAAVMPEIKPCIGFDQRNPAHFLDIWGHTAYAVGISVKEPVTRLALLLHDIGKPDTFYFGEDGKGHFPYHHGISRELSNKILTRFNCDNATKESVMFLTLHHDDIYPDTLAGIHRLTAIYGVVDMQRLLDVHYADIMAHSEAWAARKIPNTQQAEALFAELMKSDPCLSVKEMDISGADIMALGLSGKAVGEMQKKLFDAVLDGEISNNKNELIALANKLLTEQIK